MQEEGRSMCCFLRVSFPYCLIFKKPIAKQQQLVLQ